MSFAGLFEHVRAELGAASVVFGKRAIAQHLNQGPGRANRVVFVPGEGSGNLGAYGGATKGSASIASSPGRNPIALWDWTISGRVFVWAFDGEAPEDELAQWRAMVELHDAVVTAIHSYEPGFYRLRAPVDVSPALVERRFGMEMSFVVDLIQPVLAIELPVVPGPLAGEPGVTFVGPLGDENVPV